MGFPLVDSPSQHSDVANAELHDGLAEGGFGADGAEQTAVAICYAGVVQESQVERDQGTRVAAGLDARVDGFFLGRWVGWGGGGVWDAHVAGLGEVVGLSLCYLDGLEELVGCLERSSSSCQRVHERHWDGRVMCSGIVLSRRYLLRQRVSSGGMKIATMFLTTVV